MMSNKDIIQKLVEALRCLPGVGPKSAQRMVFHLLQHHKDRGLHLATCLEEAMRTIIHCTRCNNYTTETLCRLCSNPARNPNILCVVESPSDLLAIEQAQVFDGSYYVLMGKLSPLDGIGPEEIKLDQLVQLIQEEAIQEVILALNHSPEGQATIHYIQALLEAYPIKISQLAQGIPSCGELEYLDSYTIMRALKHRLVVA